MTEEDGPKTAVTTPFPFISDNSNALRVKEGYLKIPTVHG
jgi:hypothetical protein